ncbi:lysylphosphatidylglycerol synthase domain-containing protein [Methylobacterium haplocladii]|uniref:TIGR00374 family protein n=1 Tax=Methylobacterium haplocladii TaxID=1176176 RepID=A0A512IM83_9HYPH|nr:lysylphosphatidylglycerol synthase domain-containing protein [Methylobacterium haplocladii]GEO98758.1 hypothetical protein MHA02_11460 [Methylobacterium haplocladii]GJD85065.1 hypothetical protein HPGCJGGD_2951 [Methylobacterium haplocladii]GLS59249.1 hypothetical protein GCM10007887_19150 [Methylobacterium haplocladii]
MARFGRALLRRMPLVGTVLGLALGVWLIVTNDVAAIGSAFGRIGLLGLAGVVLVRFGVILLCGLAWARILDGLSAIETAAFLILRFVREGINVLLPVASVGGEVVGGRLLTFWGVGGALAAASILADMLIQVATEIAFTLFGVLLLLQVEGEAAASLARFALQALGVAVVLLAAFFAFQRLGAAKLVERGFAALGRQVAGTTTPDRAAGGSGLGVQPALDAVWDRGRRGRLAQGFLLHLAAWGLGAAEIWIALTCIGVAVTVTEVIVLESLSQAIKSAAFPVPSGLGVQEGGFVVVGALFGIDAGTAIALSLAKRVPDVVLGLPSLIAWQMLEARRATILPPSQAENS